VTSGGSHKVSGFAGTGQTDNLNVKILGKGTLTKKLKIQINQISEGAKSKIKKSGGEFAPLKNK